MDSKEALSLPTTDLAAAIAACQHALELVIDFASDALLDALEAEVAVLRATIAVRSLPELYPM